MKKFKLEEIEDVLKIKGHNYSLGREEIGRYFNYLVETLNINNPAEFFSQKCCLGLCHGLYILLYGRDLKDILDNFKGEAKESKYLLNKLFFLDKDSLSEVAVLGQLSRNGSKIYFYEHLGDKNPEASMEVYGRKYNLEVTRMDMKDVNGKNVIEKKGVTWINRLLKILEKEVNLNDFNGKTLIFSPKTVFSDFWSRMQNFNGSLNEFFISSDEVEIVDEILIGDKVVGVGYELKGEGLFCKIVVKSTFNHLYNKLSDKNKQFKGSRENFILYIEIVNMHFMGIGEMVVELQHYLRRFPNCAAVVLCERFAIEYQEKSPDLFSECYFIANGNCKDIINPRSSDEKYDFGDIDKLILCKNNYFVLTKDGNVSLISKRSFRNIYK